MTKNPTNQPSIHNHKLIKVFTFNTPCQEGETTTNYFDKQNKETANYFITPRKSKRSLLICVCNNLFIAEKDMRGVVLCFAFQYNNHLSFIVGKNHYRSC